MKEEIKLGNRLEIKKRNELIEIKISDQYVFLNLNQIIQLQEFLQNQMLK